MPDLEFPFVKVCGVTTTEDLEALAQTSANAVGINLVETSPRFVEPDVASVLFRSAKDLDLYSVAVTRDASREKMEFLENAYLPDCIQLHGSESPEGATALRSNVIKAISWSGRASEEQSASRWREAMDTNSELAERFVGFLIDAYAPEAGGGTGRQARWDLLQPRPTALEDLPLILAGGLTPKNVREAILTVACQGVDTASGVEFSPGKKSPTLMQQFSSEANHAFARL